MHLRRTSRYALLRTSLAKRFTAALSVLEMQSCSL